MLINFYILEHHSITAFDWKHFLTFYLQALHDRNFVTSDQLMYQNVYPDNLCCLPRFRKAVFHFTQQRLGFTNRQNCRESQGQLPLFPTHQWCHFLYNKRGQKWALLRRARLLFWWGLARVGELCAWIRRAEFMANTLWALRLRRVVGAHVLSRNIPYLGARAFSKKHTPPPPPSGRKPGVKFSVWPLSKLRPNSDQFKNSIYTFRISIRGQSNNKFTFPNRGFCVTFLVQERLCNMKK